MDKNGLALLRLVVVKSLRLSIFICFVVLVMKDGFRFHRPISIRIEFREIIASGLAQNGRCYREWQRIFFPIGR